MIPEWFVKEFNQKTSWLEFNQSIEINLVKRYVYVMIPKVASSTIRHRLTDDATRKLPKFSKNRALVYATANIRPFQLPDDILLTILMKGDYFRFTFMREPVERFLSAYLDKIVGGKPQMQMFLKNYAPDHNPKIQLSINDFVDHLIKIKKTQNFDKHWRPQSQLLFCDLIDYDFIGCFSRFEEDWKIVSDRINLTNPGAFYNIAGHATDAASQIDEYINDDIRSKLNIIYKEDFEIYEKILENRRL